MRISDWSSDVCSSDLIGMGCAQHNVKNIGMLLHDSRQSADHMVNSLVLRDQAKGQQYSTSGKPEARLETIGAGIGTVRHTVRNDLYQPFRYAMYPAQYVASLFRHDDHSRGTADDCLQHAALVRIGPVKHGMESRKQWNICAVQYLQQHLSRRTAENAIFVLQPKSLCAACFNSASGRDIAGRDRKSTRLNSSH